MQPYGNQWANGTQNPNFIMKLGIKRLNDLAASCYFSNFLLDLARENIPTKDYFKFHREIRILSTICALITRLHYPPPLGPHPHYIWFNIIVLNSRKAVYNTTLKIIFYIQGYICNILPFVDQMIWPVLSQFGG